MLIDIVLAIVVLIVLVTIGIVVHELGHLVCGWLTGYKFGFFKIGSFAWFKENGKIKFKISKNSVPGQCMMIPVSNEADFKFILGLLGGGIFNFLTVTILLVTWFSLPNDHLLGSIVLVGIIYNLYLSISNLFPNKSWINDGATLVEALKSTDAKRGLYLTFQFQKYLKMDLPGFKRILSAYDFFVIGNHEKANELINQAKQDIENLPNHGERLMELDYIKSY